MIVMVTFCCSARARKPEECIILHTIMSMWLSYIVRGLSTVVILLSISAVLTRMISVNFTHLKILNIEGSVCITCTVYWQTSLAMANFIKYICMDLVKPSGDLSFHDLLICSFFRDCSGSSFVF